MQHRPLKQIAQEIDADWGSKIYFGARPYLNAMYALEQITDHYGLDTGLSIVLYFLSNAGTWRGETARRIKAELKSISKQA